MNKHNNNEVIDIIGIGIGPFNLSLAALLSPMKTIRSCFFDQNTEFSWHPGMLLPDAEIQVNYLKDLVTLVDPTNPYSFIAYLAKHKRLYRFINSQFKFVLRKEFNQYLNWVSRSLPNLYFQEHVQSVHFNYENFVIRTSKREIGARHIVLGSGLKPYIPTDAQAYLGQHVYHSQDFLLREHNFQGKSVAVIGGGQSGAEIIHYILSKTMSLPRELIWITHRNQFLPTDESPFVNEFFTPTYSDYFFQLTDENKYLLLKEQTLASDGISSHLLEAIYQKLYRLELVEGCNRFFQFMPNFQLRKINFAHKLFQLFLSKSNTSQSQIISADIIILCTGYRWEFPTYLSNLSDHIQLPNGKFNINQDFSIAWNGPRKNRIYVQNAARHTHGIADPNLSLMAWRSAKIINSIAESQIYDIDNESSAIDWTYNFTEKNEDAINVSNTLFCTT